MIPVFAFPPAVRRVIYTTNAIASVTARLRKIIKTRGHFPSDDGASKLIWSALRNITAEFGRATHDWKTAMNQSQFSTRTASHSSKCKMFHLRLSRRGGRSSQVTTTAEEQSHHGLTLEIRTLPPRDLQAP